MDHILKSEVLLVVLRTSKGLPSSEFAQLFHHTHGYPFSPSRYGYHSLCQLLDDMNDVIVMVDDATQGLLIKSRHLACQMFFLVGENGSLVQEPPYLPVQDSVAALEQTGGQSGFNRLLKTEGVCQNIPVPSFLSNPFGSYLLNGHQEYPVLPQRLPQSHCGSYHPVIQPIFLPTQQSLFHLNQKANCHPQSQCPSDVFMPASEPLKPETSVIHRTSNQQLRCPMPTTAGLDHHCKKALLLDPTSTQTTGSFLYSNVVAGKRQENSLLGCMTTNVPVAHTTGPDISATQEGTSQLSLTTSNFPHLTGESRNVHKNRVSYLPEQCPSKISGPISGETQKDSICNLNSVSGHSNPSSVKPHTTEPLVITSDRLQPTMKTQMLNSHKVKPFSNSLEVKPKRATVSPELKKNILSILEEHPDGMPMGQFKSAYLCTFNRLLPLNGYPSALELLADLEDVVRIEGLGIRMLLFPNSSNVAPEATITDEGGIYSEEVDPSLTKDDVCYGDTSQDANIPLYLNRTLTSPPSTQLHVACAGTALLARPLPPAFSTRAFTPIITHPGATYMIPNSNIAASTYPPCAPLHPPLFTHAMGMGVNPPFQDHFSGVVFPVGHGYHVPMSSQQFMFNRFPNVGSFSYTVSPPLAFAPAFSTGPAFAAHPLIYPPTGNPFQAAAVSPVYPNGVLSQAQTLQSVEQQIDTQCTTDISGDEPPMPLLVSSPSEHHSSETQPQKHIPEAKKPILEQTVNMSLAQSKALPPVQRVLPFCNLSELEGINPEGSLHNSCRKPISMISMDPRRLSDQLSLPLTEPLKREVLNQEDTVLETVKEETHFGVVAHPRCKSEEAFLPKNESSEIGDLIQELSLAASSKGKSSAKSMLNSTCGSKTLVGRYELPKADNYETDDSHADFPLNEALGGRSVVDTSCQNSSSETFLEAESTTSLSGTGAALTFELPTLTAGPSDTENANSESCQIL